MADTALQAAEADRQQRQHDVDAARRAHVVADLRPHLVAGEACPVCEQTVAALPGPLRAPALDDAQARLDEAARKVTAAQQAALQAASAEQRAAAELDSLTEQRRRRVSSLTAALAGPLSGTGLTAMADLLEHGAAPPAAGRPARRRARHSPGGARHGPASRTRWPRWPPRLRARQGLDATANAAAAAAEAARARDRSAQAEAADQAAGRDRRPPAMP